MAKQKRTKKLVLKTEFRAVCRKGDFEGDWTSNEDKAYEEAHGHQIEPGKDEHIIDILRRQTSSTPFKLE